jgi:hypothetical protein
MEGNDDMKGGLSPTDGRAGITSSRPAFMEPLRSGFIPRYYYNAHQGNIFSAGGALRMRRRLSFPIKDDAGYIGYLSDSESNSSGEGNIMNTMVLRRHREELLGSDMSFSSCLMLFVTVCGLLFLFLFAASPWGIPPPRRL